MKKYFFLILLGIIFASCEYQDPFYNRYGRYPFYSDYTSIRNSGHQRYGQVIKIYYDYKNRVSTGTSVMALIKIISDPGGYAWIDITDDPESLQEGQYIYF